MASVNDFSSGNQRQSAAVGALAGAPFGPGGALTGGLLGLLIGSQKDVTEEQDRAREEQQRIQTESARFQANARAQRLSLLQTGRRFGEEEGPSQTSALAPLTQPEGLSPITQSQGSASSGTF